jgi:hypothetical protein
MTEVIEIGKEQAIALLERAVQEKGEEYVYTPIRVEHMGEKCLYATADKSAPSCIVGHALAYVGVPVEKLFELDHIGDMGAIYELNRESLNRDEYSGDEYRVNVPTALEEIAGVHLTDEAEDLFTEAQSAQDGGKTWGESIQRAKDRLELSPQDFYVKYRPADRASDGA